MLEIISRLDAAKAKKNRYFTGKRCRNGHLSERYTVSGSCIECSIEHVKRSRDYFKGIMNNG